jgi:hypothetical protein
VSGVDLERGGALLEVGDPRGGGGLSFVVGSSAVTLREFDPYLFECVCYEDNQGVPNYHPNIW